MNYLMPQTTTATELQRNYRQVAKRARRTRQPVVVLSNNKPEGVYIDYVTFTNRYRIPVESREGKKTLEKLAGSWTNEETEEFNKVIDEMFEQIDPEMWK